jgi:hypothetical protein
MARNPVAVLPGLRDEAAGLVKTLTFFMQLCFCWKSLCKKVISDCILTPFPGDR